VHAKSYSGECSTVITSIKRQSSLTHEMLQRAIGYKKPRDAQHDLMTQAVDGRVRGHVAIRDDLFGRARIMRNAQYAPALAG
jgi:hypothetical protein